MEYEGKDNDDLTSENEGPLDWSLEMLLEHAKIMFWKRYYKTNRHEHQAKQGTRER